MSESETSEPITASRRERSDVVASRAEGGASHNEQLIFADRKLFSYNDLLAAFMAGSYAAPYEANTEFAKWFVGRTDADSWGKTAN